MTDYIWPLVAALGLVLAYSALMRWLGNAPKADVNALLDRYHGLQKAFDLHRSQWDLIGVEWRQKVVELDKKCDRVVIDAKNEIAGDLATVSNITSKGWR
jgi:hypothetical protein